MAEITEKRREGKWWGKKWRGIAYELLTQGIIFLGEIRHRLTEAPEAIQKQRRDRTFYCSNLERWLCCDCKLEHWTRPLDGEEYRAPAFKFIPVRLDGYEYRLRFGAGKPSPFKNEEGATP